MTKNARPLINVRTFPGCCLLEYETNGDVNLLENYLINDILIEQFKSHVY